jgi:hypothetical protein
MTASLSLGGYPSNMLNPGQPKASYLRDGDIALDQKCQLMFADIGFETVANLSEHKLDIRFGREGEQMESEATKGDHKFG